MLAVVSVGSGGKNSGPYVPRRPSTYLRRFTSSTPGRTRSSTFSPSRSGPRILSMRERFSTRPPRGTAPAASPVRPPWVVTASPFVRAKANASRTSSSQTGKAIKSAFPTERDSSRRYRACSPETRSIFKSYSLQCSKPYCAKTSGMSHLSKAFSSGSRYQPSSAFAMRASCMAFLPSGTSPTA